MEDKLIDIKTRIIDCYRKSKNELPYDGELINHFSSLIFANSKCQFNSKRIREIRKYIKENTLWFSSYRGDNLYAISILLSLEEDWKGRFKRILKCEEKLKEMNFVEGAFLSISAWILTESYSDAEIENAGIKMCEIYNFIKDRYSYITSSEDYVICALLAVIDLDKDIYSCIIDEAFKVIKEKELTTNNGTQTLANILCIDFSSWNENLTKSINIIEELKKNIEEIRPQHMGIVGLAAVLINNEGKFINSVQRVYNYFSEETEYEFYMDRSFKLMISMVAVIFSYSSENKFINFILALTIHYELIGQQQALLEGIN